MVLLGAAAAPLIDWGSLATVAVLSIIIGVFGVSIFSLGAVGVNEYARRIQGGNRLLGMGLAVACFAIAIACVGAGLFLIVDKTWVP